MLVGCRLLLGNLWLRSSFKAIKVICVIFLFGVCTTKIHENRYLRFSDVKSSRVDPINYKHKVWLLPFNTLNNDRINNEFSALTPQHTHFCWFYNMPTLQRCILYFVTVCMVYARRNALLYLTHKLMNMNTILH